MTYWRLHYHLIWGTFERAASITPEREKMLYGVVYQKAKELEIKIHAAGNTTDHIHLVVSIPPRLSVAECVRHFKGATAHAINSTVNENDKLKWQEGYGALSVSEQALENVVAYAARQKYHHREQTTNNYFERIDE